jgi:hypothetical protein
LAMLLVFVAGMKLSFFHAVSEAHQAIAYSALLYALLSYPSKRQLLHAILVGVVTLLALFAHPFALFTCGFVIVWHFTNTRSWKTLLLWIALGIVLLSIPIRYWLTLGSYDTVFYNQIESSPFAAMLKQGCYPVKYFGYLFWTQYWLPTLIFLITLTLLIVQKRFLKLIALLAGMIGYGFIAALTFYNGDSSIMMERIYLPLFFMLFLAFGEALIALRVPALRISFCVLVIGAGLYIINQGCIIFRKRTDYLLTLIDKARAAGVQKAVIDNAQLDYKKVQVDWALGSETLVISRFENPQPVTIIPKAQWSNPASTGVFLYSGNETPIVFLNAKYFSVAQTLYAELQP